MLSFLAKERLRDGPEDRIWPFSSPEPLVFRLKMSLTSGSGLGTRMVFGLRLSVRATSHRRVT